VFNKIFVFGVIGIEAGIDAKIDGCFSSIKISEFVSIF